MWVYTHEHTRKGRHFVPSCGRHLTGTHDPLLAHGKGGDSKQSEGCCNSHTQIFQEIWAVGPEFPSRKTLGFYLYSSPHPEELINYAEVNKEYQVKGHDEHYAVPNQGASLNATVKSSSMHKRARAIPEGKQSLYGLFVWRRVESIFCRLFPLPQMRHNFHANLSCSQSRRGGLKPHSYPSKWTGQLFLSTSIGQPPSPRFFLSVSDLVCWNKSICFSSLVLRS